MDERTNMKTRFSKIGIAVLGLAIFLALNACTTTGTGPAKTLVLSGFDDVVSDGRNVRILLTNSNTAIEALGSAVAGNTVPFTDGGATVALKLIDRNRQTTTNWTGSGSYYIVIEGNQNGKEIEYTTKVKVPFSSGQTIVRYQAGDWKVLDFNPLIE